MKRIGIIKIISLFLLIISFLNVTCFGANEYSWFFVKNGNSQPNVNDEERRINRYNGFCLDRSVNDESDKRVLYLTFDVGYENGNVSKILNILESNDIKGSFFILDNILLKNLDLVKRMIDEGHLICNHTKKHKNICSYNKEQIRQELGSLEKLYFEKTGHQMSQYFRFPEGKYSESSLEFVSELGYKSVFWSLSYADWDNNNQPSPERAINKLLTNTHNGAIILLHPTSNTNVEILPYLIKKWKENGYIFSTVDKI